MRKRIHAFTLVELLFALAITSILVVLLVNMVAATLNVWEQGYNQIDSFTTARQVLVRIADEIKGARAAANEAEFSENLDALKGSTDPQPGISENIFFVAPYPNLGSGDLCVIAYRHNSDTYTLQRTFLDSQKSWNGNLATSYQSASYSSTTLNDWRTIAHGVLEFEIQSYSQQDVDSAQPTPTPAPTWNSVSGSSVMLGNTPRRVVVRIKMVDDRTLIRLQTLTVGSAAYTSLVNRAAREFRADVMLPPPH